MSFKERKLKFMGYELDSVKEHEDFADWVKAENEFGKLVVDYEVFDVFYLEDYFFSYILYPFYMSVFGIKLYQTLVDKGVSVNEIKDLGVFIQKQIDVFDRASLLNSYVALDKKYPKGFLAVQGEDTGFFVVKFVDVLGELNVLFREHTSKSINLFDYVKVMTKVSKNLVGSDAKRVIPELFKLCYQSMLKDDLWSFFLDVGMKGFAHYLTTKLGLRGLKGLDVDLDGVYFKEKKKKGIKEEITGTSSELGATPVMPLAIIGKRPYEIKDLRGKKVKKSTGMFEGAESFGRDFEAVKRDSYYGKLLTAAKIFNKKSDRVEFTSEEGFDINDYGFNLMFSFYHSLLTAKLYFILKGKGESPKVLKGLKEAVRDFYEDFDVLVDVDVKALDKKFDAGLLIYNGGAYYKDSFESVFEFLDKEFRYSTFSGYDLEKAVSDLSKIAGNIDGVESLVNKLMKDCKKFMVEDSLIGEYFEDIESFLRELQYQSKVKVIGDIEVELEDDALLESTFGVDRDNIVHTGGSDKDLDQNICLRCGRNLIDQKCRVCDGLSVAQQGENPEGVPQEFTLLSEIQNLRRSILNRPLKEGLETVTQELIDSYFGEGYTLDMLNQGIDFENFLYRKLGEDWVAATLGFQYLVESMRQSVDAGGVVRLTNLLTFIKTTVDRLVSWKNLLLNFDKGSFTFVVLGQKEPITAQQLKSILVPFFRVHGIRGVSSFDKFVVKFDKLMSYPNILKMEQPPAVIKDVMELWDVLYTQMYKEALSVTSKKLLIEKEEGKNSLFLKYFKNKGLRVDV